MRIRELRKKAGMTQYELASKIGISRSAVAMWEVNANEPDNKMLIELARLFNCTVDYLIGETDEQGSVTANPSHNYPANVLPISALHRQRVPMIGSVAAGEPIYDPEDLGVYVDSPVDADAAITIRGDSMTPTYQDGDVVYIKCRPDVPDGAVAVIFLDDEAALKHVYKRPTGLTLISDNPAHAPLMVEFSDYNNVRVFGVPVGFTRMYKHDITGKITKGFK